MRIGASIKPDGLGFVLLAPLPVTEKWRGNERRTDIAKLQQAGSRDHRERRIWQTFTGADGDRSRDEAPSGNGWEQHNEPEADAKNHSH
ncbi:MULTISPECIES: hypothetical protein [Bradyrhizobium]|uniref:hypothetical protein n=1 Tax=Bradyrhizobium TaxID=374 RepID=UPI001EDB0E38|nr:hypothetical protein [Bradyrhizobium zhengyangense]MCG2645329.1 hypothetical protein [Bradyrhizobium zhengyangense]